MHLFYYRRWDGTQDISPFQPGELVDQVADQLIEDGDIERILQRIYRWGMPGLQHRGGLQDLLERLRQLKRQQLNRYNLGSIMEDLHRRLDDVVQTERAGIERRLQQARSADAPEGLRNMLEKMAEKKQKFLGQLPKDFGGAVKALSDYEFMEPAAQEKFQELLKSLQQQLMGQYFQGMMNSIQSMTPEDLAQIREMVKELNRMLEERLQGGEPDFESFMRKYGHFFGPGIDSLDDLVESLQRRIAQMRSLLNSLSPEMRQQLQDAIDNLLRDDRLKWDLARLAANLDALYPMDDLAQGFNFRGQEDITFEEAMRLMGQLQDITDLESQLDPDEGRIDPQNIDVEKVRQLLGDEAARQVEELKQLEKALEEAGYIERKGNRMELTPKAIRRIGQKALQDIFSNLKATSFGNHPTAREGTGGDRSDESKPYQFGDPFHLDIEDTLMNAVEREGPGTPVRIRPDDFQVYRTERLTQTSTVLLLDMSRSMFLRGCFTAAKKMALALHSLIRGQYPRDNLYLVAFSQRANPIRPEDLPWLDGLDYQYGTNMQHAFQVARKLLAAHKGGTRQIILVTDGEPTAHMEGGRVYFSYPPTYRTIQESLKEVMRCTREGITINTFMLERGFYLLDFVEQMTKINKGRAFYTTPERLGEYVVVDYVLNRRRRVR
jgi:uncharacterized protein with von Willebrand factor type A (vWA) domain